MIADNNNLLMHMDSTFRTIDFIFKVKQAYKMLNIEDTNKKRLIYGH